MSKHCPKCGTRNPEDGFWCKYCNSKITQTISVQNTEPTSINSIHYNEKSNRSSYVYSNQPHRYGVSFIGFSLGGLIALAVIITVASLNLDFDFSGINCKINDDFWFEGNYLNTSDGWTFTMNKIKDYSLNGIVLGLKTYSKNDIPYRPINIFSPIDLVIGIDDVADNPDKYPYSVRYEYRGYWVSFQGQNAGEAEYMKTHMGNNHIIPHNEIVLNQLKNISINDIVFIDGSLVSLYGSRGDEKHYWTTDTQIGNYNCEIILVDEITLK